MEGPENLCREDSVPHREGWNQGFAHDALERELLGAVVEETTAGFRLNHKSGAHDDHVVSMALACLEASKGSDNDAPIRGLGRTTFGRDVEPSGGVCHI